MQTILEIYYLRIVGKSVHYQRKQVNLSKKGGDPDHVLQDLIQEKRDLTSGGVEKQEFVVHSTSWRYARPKKIMLTYVAYSDELEFEKETYRSLPLKNLRRLTKNSRKPRSRTELENKVVSHGMRHLAFLIRTETQIDFKSALRPETREIFEKLWISLAGKLF
jgi:hypothetical protein